jgi:hemerythrin-like domain-containing protein
MDSLTTLTIIKDEHRRLTAVVRGLEYLARDAVDRGIEPDHRVLGMLLDYIEAFPNRFHHPKEEFLFDMLAKRSARDRAVVDELRVEHERVGQLASNLRDLLSRSRGNEPRAMAAFAAAVATYAEFHWQHMRKEEDVVLPLAERKLPAGDWRALEAAFHTDDRLLAADDFRRLFQLIVRVAPPAVVRLLVAADL